MVASWSSGEITVLYKLPLSLGNLQYYYSVPGRLTRCRFSGEFQTHFRVFCNPRVRWHFLVTFTHLPVNMLSRRTFWTRGGCQLEEGDWQCCRLYSEPELALKSVWVGPFTYSDVQSDIRLSDTGMNPLELSCKSHSLGSCCRSWFCNWVIWL